MPRSAARHRRPASRVAVRADNRRPAARGRRPGKWRSEEHTSELQSLMRNSYAVFCLKKKKKSTPNKIIYRNYSGVKSRTQYASEYEYAVDAQHRLDIVRN